MPEKPAKPAKEKEKEITIELIPSLEPKLGRAYANYAQVSHSPWDFTIRFCEAPSSADIVRLKRAGGKVEIPNMVEVIMAPGLIPSVIKALKINYEKYMKAYEEKADEPSS